MKDVLGIKNPLTIIAIFAGIAEIGGTVVLPFISPDNQRLYIWFLIFFPTALIALFFLTLNFNHSVLYAPSDWRNENNFFRKFTKATPAAAEKKIQTDLLEADENELNANKLGSDETEKTVPIEPAHDQYQAKIPDESIKYSKSDSKSIIKYKQLESFALSKLNSDTGISFESAIQYKSMTSPQIVFDGYAHVDGVVHIAEIKLFKRPVISGHMLDHIFSRFKLLEQDITRAGKKLKIHYVLVAEGFAISRLKPLLDNKVKEFADTYDLSVDIHYYSLHELEGRL